MLEQAQSKFEQYSDKFKQAFVNFQKADIQDIDNLTTNDGKPQKFDTVIDTFGLCSCSDPVEALVSLANACKDSEDSRILLLEHGKSHYDWLNNLLDKNADKHVSKWGCWWNRDFMSIFEDERVTREIDIEKVSRWHLGTTYYVIAKKKKTKQV
jgi:methyltransferase OMS1